MTDQVDGIPLAATEPLSYAPTAFVSPSNITSTTVSAYSPTVTPTNTSIQAPSSLLQLPSLSKPDTKAIKKYKRGRKPNSHPRAQYYRKKKKIYTNTRKKSSSTLQRKVKPLTRVLDKTMTKHKQQTNTITQCKNKNKLLPKRDENSRIDME